MKPLVHPALDDVTVEGILYALSDPVRLAIYVEIVRAECSHSCTTVVRMSEQAVAKSTLSLHFKVLREAGLIRGERRGVEMMNIARCPEINAKFPGLLGAIVAAYGRQVAARELGAAARRPSFGAPR